MHSRAPEFTPGFFGGFRVAHLLRFFCVVLLYVFTIRVPCCDVCYDFHMETMLDSSLPPVVYRRARVLFASYLYASVIVVSNTYCVVFLFCFVFLRLVWALLPVSLDCPFFIGLSVFSNAFFHFV